MRPPSPTKISLFTREVWIVTEWRDGAVYKRKKVGEVMAFLNDLPFKPGCGAALVPKSTPRSTS
jgi:hypothetical protein